LRCGFTQVTLSVGDKSPYGSLTGVSAIYVAFMSAKQRRAISARLVLYAR